MRKKRVQSRKSSGPINSEVKNNRRMKSGEALRPTGSGYDFL